MSKMKPQREMRPPLAFLESLECELDGADEESLYKMHEDFATQELEEVIYILAARRRLKVVCALTDGPLTQKHISRATGIKSGHLSRVLKQMIEGGIIVCRTPKLRKFKTYGFSAKGNVVKLYLITLVWEKKGGFSMTPLEMEFYGNLKEVLDESSDASGFGEWS
jgi:DNA-binding HxlR family transcriptional regulator